MASTSITATHIQYLTCSFTVPGRHLTTVNITVRPNSDPARSGSCLLFPDQPPDAFIDFPACTATVTTPEDHGYAAMYGWIQFVLETPLNSPAAIDPSNHKWNHDPIPITSDLNTPFIYFGTAPTLFDAPFRTHRTDMNWTCWSFLTYITDSVMTKHVHPILGFEWGFAIEDGSVRIKVLRMVDVGEAWETQRELLEGKFDGWRFGVVNTTSLSSNPQ